MTTNSPPQDTRSQWLGAMVLVALGLIFIWRSLADLPLGTITDPGPAAAPLLLASLLIACALWSLLGRTSGLLVRAGTDQDAAEPGGLRHALLITAAAIFAALALGPLGYRLTILAILLFFLGLGRTQADRRRAARELRPVVRQLRAVRARLEDSATDRAVRDLTASACGRRCTI
jgi:hypothetical protein